MEKNRKTFIAQLMSFAAINSLASVPVCLVGSDLAAGGYATLLLRLQPLLSSVVVKKERRKKKRSDVLCKSVLMHSAPPF